MPQSKKSYTMDKQIDQYLSGNMKPKEEKRFLKNLQSDTALRERAYLTALVIRAAIQSTNIRKK